MGIKINPNCIWKILLLLLLLHCCFYLLSNMYTITHHDKLLVVLTDTQSAVLQSMLQHFKVYFQLGLIKSSQLSLLLPNSQSEKHHNSKFQSSLFNLVICHHGPEKAWDSQWFSFSQSYKIILLVYLGVTFINVLLKRNCL